MSREKVSVPCTSSRFLLSFSQDSALSTQDFPRLRTSSRGFTLLEVLVSVTILLALGMGIVIIVRLVLDHWRVGERRRVVYTRALAALDLMTQDLTETLSREPLGVSSVRVRFICDRGATGQRLMFVRSLEAGPERTHTYYSGMDVRHSELYDNVDNDNDGVVDNHLQALGGMMEVAYYLGGPKGRTLMRGIRAPVQGAFLGKGGVPFGGNAQPLIEDVLHLGFRFWHQYTASWKEQDGRKRAKPKRGRRRFPRTPVRIWDSTRGVLPKFILHRRPDKTRAGGSTASDPSDDVFPEMVEITLVIENDPLRTTRTALRRPIGEAESVILVDSTQGFPDVPKAHSEGGPRNYIRIGNEWIRYKTKERRAFIASQRGARGTARVNHNRGASVHVGETFIVRVYVPAFKEDWSGK